jgi:hypothetical protein
MNLQRYNLKPVPSLVVIVLLAGISIANAQDLEPRAYTNIPTGLNFIAAGYAYTAGGVIFDPTIPLDNANIKVHGAVLAFARSIKVGGMSGKVDIILPYAWLSGSAEINGEKVYRDISGFGDTRLRMSVNFFGAPALPLSGFKDYKQDLVIGASLQVFLPMGQYDPDRLVNIGTHRFTFKPELGISKTISHLQLEMAAGAAFHTVNNEFYQGKTRSQAPIGSIQGHANYNFKKGIWLALDGTYYWGGHTTLDGVEGEDLQKNTRMGITFALPVSIHHTLRIFLSTGVSTRTGSDFDAVGFLWQYRWGKDIPKVKKS